jgi:predicted nucleotide-binding protein (sugar kinase/HSP70/actin superfamily)
MPFDSPNTCPEIDKNIDIIQESLNNVVDTWITENLPFLKDEKYDLIGELSTELYESIESSIENVRDSNVNLRNEAECQVDELESTIDELNEELDGLRE